MDSKSNPLKARFLGSAQDHEQISEVDWSALEKEGDRLIFYSELGGHTSSPTGSKGGTRQDSWSAGSASNPNGDTMPSGRLLNIGARRASMNGQNFVYYSGLWGAPSKYATLAQNIPMGAHAVKEIVEKLVYASSGYWVRPLTKQVNRMFDPGLVLRCKRSGSRRMLCLRK
jgi:hypothetical protein